MSSLDRRSSALTRFSLVRRLIVLAAAWSLMVLLAAGFALSVFFNHAAMARFDDELGNTIDGLVAGVSADAGQVQAPTSDDPRTLRAYSGDYWQLAVASGNGLRALSRSRSLWDRALPPPRGGSAALAAAAGKTIYYDSVGPLKQPLRIAALQGRLPEISTPIVFMAAEDRSPVDREARTFDTTMSFALVLLGAGLIAAVIVQVRVGLSPLFALRREVADLRMGKAERVIGDYPVELAPLAGELNALMAHNQEVLERQRTHVGNLAHALKTPLSVLMAEAGQQPGLLADVVQRQAEAMGRHVDHHLRRARAAAHAQSQGERTPVAPVLDELSRTLRKIFRVKAVMVDYRCDDRLAFQGERQDLLEIVGNVMENACQWCVRLVHVEALAQGARHWMLTVEDDGVGLAEGLREEMLRRGARVDEDAPGSGLGLSIVDDLARAYSGSVRLGKSDLGGLKVQIVLPRSEADRPAATGGPPERAATA